jgi:hypothetical protein
MYRALVLCGLFALSCAQLYGVTYDNHLVQLTSATNGVWTEVGPAFAPHSQFVTLVQVADIDITNSTFYLVGINRTTNGEYLVGLDLYTGRVTTRHTLPFYYDFDFTNTPGLDWIPGTHDVLVYGVDRKTRQYLIYRITPATGNFNLIASFQYPNYFLQSIDTYDSVNNLLWVQLSGQHQLVNLAFDITSGKLVWNLTDVYGIMSLNFNPINGLVYGVASNTQGTMVVTIDGTSGKYNVVGSLTSEQTAVAGPQNAGLDYNTGNIYIYLQTSNNPNLFALIPINEPSNFETIPASSVIPLTIVFGNE